MVIQQKTNRPVQFEIMSDARGSLLAWLERRGGSIEDFAFPSRVDHSAHMSTRQYARLGLSTAQMATLQHILIRAIETEHVLETGELLGEPLPTRDHRNAILFYEATEGGAGVLKRLIEDPARWRQP